MPAQMGAFCRELDALVAADVLELPLAPLLCRGGAGAPIERAEALDRQVREGVAERVATALRACASVGPQRPLAVSLPGPSILTGGAEADDEALDVATLALSDLVRALGGESVAWLLIDEPAAAGRAPLNGLARQAAHYGWRSALVGGEAADVPGFDIFFRPSCTSTGFSRVDRAETAGLAAVRAVVREDAVAEGLAGAITHLRC